MVPGSRLSFLERFNGLKQKEIDLLTRIVIIGCASDKFPISFSSRTFELIGGILGIRISALMRRNSLDDGTFP